MQLHIIGSNSLGNGYVLNAEKEALVLEAGCRIRSVKKALSYNTKKCLGVLVTHKHQDHAKYVHEFIKAGIKVYAPDDVFSGTIYEGNFFTKKLYPNRGYRIGGFKVFVIEVVHDVPCFAYLVEHEEMGKLLFVTDTITLPVRVNGINHIMIEANYADDIVDENIRGGKMPEAMRKRLYLSHMEIGQTKEVLAENDLSKVSDIVLIHLSDLNSDEKRFVGEVRKQTGKMVYAAKAGMTLDISANPY